jgi:hypothetical protein
MISPKAARDFLHIGALHIDQSLAEIGDQLEHMIDNVAIQ